MVVEPLHQQWKSQRAWPRRRYVQPFLPCCPLQSRLEARQLQLFIEHLSARLLQQTILRFMAFEHVEQQRGTDLQLTCALAGSGKASMHQAGHLSNGSVAVAVRRG